MRPKIWKVEHGTLTVTKVHVIDNNGGTSMWTHEEFLAKAGGILHSILKKTYGEKIYQEAVDLVMSLVADKQMKALLAQQNERPGGVEDNATDS